MEELLLKIHPWMFIASLKFVNAGATTRVINQAMLEVLYTGSSTWITSSTLSPYHRVRLLEILLEIPLGMLPGQAKRADWLDL